MWLANIPFASDIVLFSSTAVELERMLNQLSGWTGYEYVEDQTDINHH